MAGPNVEAKSSMRRRAPANKFGQDEVIRVLSTDAMPTWKVGGTVANGTGGNKQLIVAKIVGDGWCEFTLRQTTS